jgi:hypothetical protein
VAELFSVVIGCGTFMIAWNARRFLNNNYLLLLGTACLFVAVLDLAHALAYKGMNILPGNDANQATQLWIAARFTESLSLLLAPAFLHRRMKRDWCLQGMASAHYFMLSIFAWPVFPVCYIEGSGPRYSRLSEYVICLVLQRRICCSATASIDNQVLRWLLVARVNDRF